MPGIWSWGTIWSKVWSVLSFRSRSTLAPFVWVSSPFRCWSNPCKAEVSKEPPQQYDQLRDVRSRRRSTETSVSEPSERSRNLDREKAKSCSPRGSGCGSVGWAVASDTRDPLFKPRHWQNFIYQLIYQLYNWKDKNKEKGAGKGPP